MSEIPAPTTTTAPATPPASAPGERRRNPAVIRAVNRLMRPLLRSPLHRLVSKKIALLTFKGRKSGKEYVLPVSYVQTDDTTLLLGTETPWYKNLRGGVPVSVRLRGKTRTGTAETVEDTDGLRAAYRQMLTRDSGYGRFINVSLGPDGEPPLEQVARARARGLVAIHVRLNP